MHLGYFVLTMNPLIVTYLFDRLVAEFCNVPSLSQKPALWIDSTWPCNQPTHPRARSNGKPLTEEKRAMYPALRLGSVHPDEATGEEQRGMHACHGFRVQTQLQAPTDAAGAP
jgi:hypothetical protein